MAGQRRRQAGQGGIVGPYVPIAAANGTDLELGLGTSMTVSTNFAVEGGSVTVTLSVTANF